MERIVAEMAKRKARAIGRTPEYRAWILMRSRCNNPNNQAFSDYGGRGIRVCAEWQTSFPAFLDHVGKRPSRQHSIDRIDNSRWYEPGNMRWTTSDVQNANKRDVVPISFRGETMTLNKWAQRIGMRQCVLRQRIVLLGWDVERALTTPASAYRARGHAETLESTKS